MEEAVRIRQASNSKDANSFGASLGQQRSPQLRTPEQFTAHRQRTNSPLAQYALFPLPPSRSPRASPVNVSPHFSPTSPPTIPLPPVPNTPRNSTVLSSPSLEVSRPGSGYFSFQAENSKYGLGISHLVEHASPLATMSFPPTPEDSDDASSILSSTDGSIDAVSSEGGETDNEPSTSLPGPIQLKRRSVPVSLASSSSTTSLAIFEELVSIARNGEAEAKEREAQEAALHHFHLEGSDAETDSSSDDEEWEQRMSGQGNENRDLRQESTLSLDQIRSRFARPDMRTRQSTVRPSWPQKPRVRQELVFDECSSSDEEAFDLSLDTTKLTPPQPPSPSSSTFSSHRRASTHTEISQSSFSTAATSIDTSDSLPAPVESSLRPFHLPSRIQQRKASAPAISFAESPVKPEREMKQPRTAISTPNLRSRLPLFGRKTSLKRLSSNSLVSVSSTSSSIPSILQRTPYTTPASSQRSSVASIATVTEEQIEKPLPQLPQPPAHLNRRLRTMRSSPAISNGGIVHPSSVDSASIGRRSSLAPSLLRRGSLIPSRFTNTRVGI